MSQQPRYLLAIHGAVLLFGLAAVLGKLLDLGPTAIVFGRVALAAPALLLAMAVCRLPLRPPSVRILLAFAALGVLLAVHWTTFFQSVQDAGVTIALITYSTFPVFVVLLEPPLFGERFRVSDLGLAGLAVVGVGILLPDLKLRDRVTQGVLWGVASGLTFALLSLLNRKYVRLYSSITLAFYQDAFAALVLLPFVVRLGSSLTGRDVALLLVLGVLCTAVAHALFISGMRGVPARTASMIACLEPVYGSALAVVMLHEELHGRTIAGGVLVVAVAFYVTLRGGHGHG